MLLAPPAFGRRAVVAGCSAILLTVSACSGADDSEGADDAQGGFPRTVEHAMGETTIEEEPRTVAALDSSFVDAALALDAEVVASTRYPGDSPQLPDYLSEEEKSSAEDAIVVGELESPDVEQLYEAAPDLVVSANIRHEAMYDEISGAAPTVFSETTGLTWKDNIRLLAEALGEEDLAEERIGEYEERAEKIGEAIREEYGEDASVTLARFTEGEATVRLYSSASFPGTIFEDVGIQRPEGQPDTEDDIHVDLSQEEIGELDADNIFVSTYNDPETDEGNPQDRFQANPLWDTLEGDVSGVDDTSWITSVSLQGAHVILDDLAEQFDVDPARP